MSLKFNSTSSPYDGIIQRIEQAVYGQDGLGAISGNAQLLGQWTTSVNLALTNALSLIFQADGRWQFDDSNHTDFPIITTNIVSGQRNYTFTTDETGNLILDIEKVAILQGATETIYREITPTDISKEYSPLVADDTGITGVPTQYDKLGNAIFFDPIPDYNATNGLKIYISREGSFFNTSDTTKKPGIDARLHEYLVYKPAFEYALDNNLANTGALQIKVQTLENLIEKIYAGRTQDERKILTNKKINYI